MIRRGVGIKFGTIVLLTVASAVAQSSDQMPVTDAEKIADAMRGGPAFITKDATLLDWPAKPGGEYRILRKALTNGPVFRVIHCIHTMSRAASTLFSCAGCRIAMPAARRI